MNSAIPKSRVLRHIQRYSNRNTWTGMHSIKNIPAYYREHGLRALIQHAWRVVSGTVQRKTETIVRAISETRAGGASVESLLGSRFGQLSALQVIRVSEGSRRVNLITDSVNRGSLFGGVGTALILSALRANQLDATLRVITRTESPQIDGLNGVLSSNGIRLRANPEVVFVPVGSKDKFVDVHDMDEFMTTSWWTTYSTLRSIPPKRITYLLQEDERMFYPHGDDWVLCHETLSRTDLHYLINTELLYRHFVSSGQHNFDNCATWFEPAFPDCVYHRVPHAQAGKLTLCFYARPNNLRNLFYRGIELINEGLLRGILDPKLWKIVFIGKDIPQLSLACGCETIVMGPMSWKEYAAFLRTVDLGVYLMATPHPSYPPLDLAASGGVVLTNRFGLKTDLSAYSENIVLADLAVSSLTEGLSRAVVLAMDSAQRERNYAASGLGRSWQETFSNCQFAGDS